MSEDEVSLQCSWLELTAGAHGQDHRDGLRALRLPDHVLFPAPQHASCRPAQSRARSKSFWSAGMGEPDSESWARVTLAAARTRLRSPHVSSLTLLIFKLFMLERAIDLMSDGVT